MISLDTIEKEISELETRDTSYATVERLAWLYICRDHLKNDVVTQEAVVEVDTPTEFLTAVSGRPIFAVLHVLNDHMSVLGAVYPKEYNAILEKIREVI